LAGTDDNLTDQWETACNAAPVSVRVTWKMLVPLSIANDTITLTAPPHVAKNWSNERRLATIALAMGVANAQIVETVTLAGKAEAPAATAGSRSTALPANALDIAIENRKAKAHANALRFCRSREDHWPECVLLPLVLMFPWRVLRVLQILVNGILTPAPVQNYWIGRAGCMIFIVMGRLDADGAPTGIPAHVFPLLMTSALITEYLYPRDKDTHGTHISLGDSLREWLRVMGYKGVRGRRAEEKALKRLRQYFETSFRIIEFPQGQAGEDRCYHAYQEIVKTGVLPGPAPIGDRESVLRVPGDRETDAGIVADYEIWDLAMLNKEWDQRGPLGYVNLSEAFVARIERHAVPLSPYVLSALVNDPQALSLYAWITSYVYKYWQKRGEKDEWTPWKRVDAIQDHIGLNRPACNTRPGPLLRTLVGRPSGDDGPARGVAPNWIEAALWMGKPECCLVAEIERGPRPKQNRVRFKLTPPLVDPRSSKVLQQGR
jgi:hypothetical protein